MNDREKLLRRLSEQQFAAHETALFLDTHPNCESALKAHREYTAAAEALMKKYNESYGMLTHRCPHSGSRWQWICDPWPWDLD